MRPEYNPDDSLIKRRLSIGHIKIDKMRDRPDNSKPFQVPEQCDNYKI
jgi:hypothetical protein